MDEKRRKERLKLEIHNTPDDREHFHQDVELIYLLEGNLDVVMGEQTSHLKPEDLIVINANKRHSLKSNDKLLYVRLSIEYQMISDVFKSMNVIFWCDSTKDESERYDELRNAMKELLNHFITTEGDTANFGHIALSYRILDILSMYFLVQMSDKEILDDQDKFEERIQQINNYIRANYSQPISLKELADKLYLSNGYLSRFFKKNYGMSFAEYLTNIRLFHAVDDLLYSNIPITRIAYDNGFTSVAVFNKAFKKAYAETPSSFRKKSKDRETAPEKQQPNEEIEKRLEEYLIANTEVEAKETEVESYHNSFSVVDAVPLQENWGKMINMGSASDLLRSEIREHIILLKEALGFQYVRFTNLFSNDMLLNAGENGEFNFSRIDSILDFLMLQGLKPHFEMGKKPKLIMYNAQKAEIVDGTREVEFMDPDTWEKFLTAFLRHMVHRYGRSEVDTWRMELWFNENKWDEAGSFDIYLELFDIMYKTARKYSEGIMLGGCGIRLDFQEEMRVQFYREWVQRAFYPDFISVIVYPYNRGEEKQDRYAIRSTDNEYMMHKMVHEKLLLEKAGMGNIPIYITEWNLTLSVRNYINDTPFKGAYIIKNLLNLYGEVDDIGYYMGTDRASEFYDSSELLHGGIGVIAKDGILKPAGFAFEFMHRLYSRYIGKGENYLISTDGHDSYGIVCHNQRALGYRYYFTKEDEIEKERMWKYFEDRTNLELDLELKHAANGIYQIKTYRINEKNGSVLDIWADMGYEKDLSRNDIKYFRRVCEPKLTIQKMEVSGNSIKLNIPMQPNEIAFVRVRLLAN